LHYNFPYSIKPKVDLGLRSLEYFHFCFDSGHATLLQLFQTVQHLKDLLRLHIYMLFVELLILVEEGIH